MKEQKLSQSFEDFSKLSPQFTGERYTLGAGVRIAYEHFNRYCFALSNIKESDVVLDLACGTGYGAILLAQKAKYVYAVDIDQTSLDLLDLVCQKNQITNIRTLNCDICQIEKSSDLIGEKISIVVCHELIEHISESAQQSLLKKISTGTAPFAADCKFLVSTPEKSKYNSISASHNEFHQKELTQEEFVQILSANFKKTKFFWQMPISGDLIAPFEIEKQNKHSVSFVNWTNSNNIVGYPSSSLPEKLDGTYMYAICGNTELNYASDISLLVDSTNKELLERFVIAAEELMRLRQKVTTDKIVKERKLEISDKTSEQKLLVASSKKIKNLIFETEKIAGEKVLLQRRLAELEKEFCKIKLLQSQVAGGLFERMLQEPGLVAEAIAYYDLRHRFAHRLGNYILFKIQRKKPVILLNRFYKFIRLVLAS